MSDDFDSMFDAAPPVAAPAVAEVELSPTTVPGEPPAATPAAAEVQAPAAAVTTVTQEAVAPSIRVALYKPGADVRYEGEPYTVGYVHISRKGLFVQLKEKYGVVAADKLDIPLTRVVLPLGAYQPLQTLLSAPKPPGPARTK